MATDSAVRGAASLVEAGKEPKQDHLPSVLDDGIKDPSLIIANGDRPPIILRVVPLVWITSRVLQQLLDALIGQSSRGLEKNSLLPVRLLHRL